MMASAINRSSIIQQVRIMKYITAVASLPPTTVQLRHFLKRKYRRIPPKKNDFTIPVHVTEKV
jgi:hypothetical protein